MFFLLVAYTVDIYEPQTELCKFRNNGFDKMEWINMLNKLIW